MCCVVLSCTVLCCVVLCCVVELYTVLCGRMEEQRYRSTHTSSLGDASEWSSLSYSRAITTE